MSIIEVKNLSKRYNIGQHERYLALRDTLALAMKSPLKWLSSKFVSSQNTEFWALKDINFTMEKGEVLGIIGANGAGKSTLLKILSQITPPTGGEIRLGGRVGSLLEVGTGFHPELTGRENIYLNGAILGMQRKEIERKFDQIVEFSGIDEFLDTPVKRYSSGMYVRLAFSVAAHLEPDILIVDEVLAVGDAEFQKKCLGKMEEVTRADGRTILFVSHNMAAVSSLCTRALVLNKGKAVFLGDVEEAIKLYNQDPSLRSHTSWEGKAGDENITLLKTWAKTLDQSGEFQTTSDIEIGMEAEVHKPVNDLIMGFTLYSEFGYELAYVLYDDRQEPPAKAVLPGRLSKKFVIPANTLAEGSYRVEFDIGIHMTKKIIRSQGELVFEVSNASGLGRRFRVPNMRGRSGLFRPDWLKE